MYKNHRSGEDSRHRAYSNKGTRNVQTTMSPIHQPLPPIQRHALCLIGIRVLHKIIPQFQKFGIQDREILRQGDPLTHVGIDTQT